MATVAAAAQDAPSSPPAAQQAAESPLAPFLRWLIANGVQGVGVAGSKIGLYEGDDGERGVACLQPIAAGEAVMTIPLRLAVTDEVGEEDEDSAAAAAAGRDEEAGNSGSLPLLLQEQPWSVRLAGKLLEMVADPSCPWQPYLQVLPKAVPSPLTTFSWEDVQAIEYPLLRQQLDHASWLASSASQQGAARFSREQWEWALSVVHSRTFGAPSAMGGVGVRMLVPLVDMLNHAGDAATSAPGATPPTVQACDNVRWDLKAPVSGGEGAEAEWRMVVSATRDVAAGEELLLSYGERSNDDFMLHYGFCPPRNPHDDVALFTDIEAAIDWWLDSFLPVGSLTPAQLQFAVNSAYTAAEDQDGAASAAAGVLDAVPDAEAEVIRAELARIKLSAGGMVDGRLMAAYRSLYEVAAAVQQQKQSQQQQQADGASSSGSSGSSIELGGSWQGHLQAAVGRRCRELLLEMPTPLQEDLSQLAAWEQETRDGQHSWAAVQRYYANAVEGYEARHGPLQQLQPAGDAGAAAAEAEAIALPEVPAAAAGPVLLDAGAAAGVDAALAQLLLQQAQMQQAAVSCEAGDASSGSSSSGEVGSILPVQYRCYKKMILWDGLLLSAQ